jgi:hypothetical protein
MTDILQIISMFQVPRVLVDAIPYGSGHINDTYFVRFQEDAGPVPVILQRINHQVFKQPEKLMDNVTRVTRFARECIQAAGGDPERETLNLIPTQDGGSFYRSQDGEYWRCYQYISGAHTYDKAEDLRQVYTAAQAFGNFQKLLARLPGERLHETIPDFHHTRKRFAAFLTAVKNDTAGRARTVGPEIDFILQREADASIVVDLLGSGELPERVTHNDTKLNNVLIDDLTGEGICVIDLDTMMPGSTLYDFGDLVRMGAASAVEDEPDLDKVGLDLSLFEALAHGYLKAARDFLIPLEWELLPFGGKLITFEQGIRFLGDYLNGDVYYKIHHPHHNLDRARTQLKMVAEMERLRDVMEAIINSQRSGTAT